MTNQTITHPKAQRFAAAFFADRTINRTFYQRIPADCFDFRMVDTPTRQSDSPRESLAHQIRVQREYLQAIETGQLHFGSLQVLEGTLRTLSQAELLVELDAVDAELVRLLVQAEHVERSVTVPWSADPIDVISMLAALHAHEILHTGWNLAVIDHLEMERFAELKAVWG